MRNVIAALGGSDQLRALPRSIMAFNTSKTMIAALQVSLDGFIEGPHGEKDWADSWASAIELIPDVDTFVLGARMYPGYGEYWEAIYASPERVPSFQERLVKLRTVDEPYLQHHREMMYIILSQLCATPRITSSRRASASSAPRPADSAGAAVRVPASGISCAISV